MTTLDLRRHGGVLILTIFGAWGCAPSPVPPPRLPDAASDAPADRAPTDTPADVPADLASTDAAPDALPGAVCGDGGVCGGGQRCDLARMRCVECLVTDHCGGATPVCASGRCVAATPCTSSRMCPAQVCDLTRMRCVDCVADMDCDPGLRCVANVCAATATCRSSRDCSAASLVCDLAAMRCVECVEDRDCAMGRRCGAGRVCVEPPACTPGVATCVSNVRVRNCDAMGVATERDCAAGEVCTAGACRALLCSPGAVSCESAAARRTCNADGMAYTVTACAAGEMCVGGECRAPGCTPGAASCTSTTERRVCNADGRTFTTTACPAGQSCSGGACAATTDCPAGQTRCGAACVDLQRDATHCGRCANACPTGAGCDAGMCAVATAPMITARAVHALVLLRDGGVLAIGGQRPPGVGIREVERYDPATNRWEARAPLLDGVQTFNAATLDDGRIVVGGSSENTLQIYNPTTDTWARLTTYPERTGHAPTAALWRAGRVYVFDSLRMASYDLATNRWRSGPDLVGLRGNSTCSTDPSGSVHAMGLTDVTRRAVFSTATETWTLLPASGLGPRNTVAFSPEGDAFAFGDFDSMTVRSLASASRANLERNVVTPLAPMPAPRSFPTAIALPGGRFLVTGGILYTGRGTDPTYLNTAAIYTVATNTWR